MSKISDELRTYAEWWSDSIYTKSSAEKLRALAELIDPDGLTCHMDEDDGEIPSSIIDNLTTWFCSGCGSPIYNDMKPTYCPYCGAEVVTDDAD